MRRGRAIPAGKRAAEEGLRAHNRKIWSARFAEYNVWGKPFRKRLPPNIVQRRSKKSVHTCRPFPHLQKSPTNVACCNQIHDCPLPKNTLELVCSTKNLTCREPQAARSQICAVLPSFVPDTPGFFLSGKCMTAVGRSAADVPVWFGRCPAGSAAAAVAEERHWRRTASAVSPPLRCSDTARPTPPLRG